MGRPRAVPEGLASAPVADAASLATVIVCGERTCDGNVAAGYFRRDIERHPGAAAPLVRGRTPFKKVPARRAFLRLLLVTTLT